jgi:endonuclease/exonuclease/phosphatase family metal-dependent hydrolase
VPRAYVLLLQEATAPLGPEDGFAFFVPLRHPHGRIIGNAIVSSLPLADARAVVLPRQRQPRAAVAAGVAVAGLNLFVVSVHLENRGAWWQLGPLDEAARGRQATALVGALPRHAFGIVGGDLNTWLGPNEPAWRTLLTRFPDTPPRSRYDATFWRRALLDHLFFDLPDGWTAERRVLPDRYGSDHHPVLGQLFRPSPGR